MKLCLLTPAGPTPPRLAPALLQLEKVLLIWQRKAIIGDTLLQPALLQTRTKRAVHDAAWGDAEPAAQPAGSAAAPSAAALAQRGQQARAGAPAGGGAGTPARRAAEAPWPLDAAGMWRRWGEADMNGALQLKLMDEKVGAGVEPPVGALRCGRWCSSGASELRAHLLVPRWPCWLGSARTAHG